MPIPPVAPKRPHVLKIHGDARTDNYYWLRDRENPEVIAYLESENQYSQEMLTPLTGLRESLYQDMRQYIPEGQTSAPSRHGDFYYYWRLLPGQQYRTYCRKRASTRTALDSVPEEIILDVNSLADDRHYLDVSVVKISPDNSRLLYLENRDGTDRYTLHVKDLASGQRTEVPIPDVFIFDSAEWDATGHYIYYLTVDALQRPYRLFRRHIPSGQEDLLYEERDPAFELEITASRSKTFLFLTARTKTCSEVWYLPADNPQASLTLFQERRPNIRYSLEHWQDQFLILTNQGAEHFQLLAVDSHHPDPDGQKPLLPYNPAQSWEGVLPFKKSLVIYGRENGLSQVWLYRDNGLERVEWEEPLYTVAPGGNLAYDTDELLVNYESMITPRTYWSIHLVSGDKTRIGGDDIGHYDPGKYEQRQLWARASDGTPIPISIVAKRTTFHSGPAPLILRGYGSYGRSSEPTFDPSRLALLNRGVAYAIAHVRGGSEMGYGWYLDGKLKNKRHTFTDFIAAAAYLMESGYTTPQLLAAQGRSAGGLLLGAVINMRPDLFQAAAPGVPFVDVVTTMLDATIPLTAQEWDEWGNPANEEDYVYMKSYSPYDNVQSQPYPHLYVTAGLNDPRVGYFEPAKWVAKLRELKVGDNPVLFKIHMGSGHFGSSGRWARYWEQAEEYAFLLDKLGVRQ